MVPNYLDYRGKFNYCDFSWKISIIQFNKCTTVNGSVGLLRQNIECKLVLLIFFHLTNSLVYFVERETVVDYPTSLWSDYPTDYPISDTRPPVVPSVG